MSNNDDNNRRKLYDALSEDYDMGSYEQFVNDIQDEGKRRKLYEATSEVYDYGDYESFSRQLGMGGASPEAATEQAQAAGQQPATERQQAAAATEQQQPWQPTAEEAVRDLAQVEEIVDQARQTMAAMDSQTDNMREYYGKAGIGSPRTVEGGLHFNPGSGKLEQTYLTPTGERTFNKAAADARSREYRDAVDMTVGGQLRRARRDLAELQRKSAERAQELHDEWARDYEENKAPLAAVFAANTYVPNIQSDQTYRALQAAIRQTEEQIKTLGEQQDRENGVDVGFWRGFGRVAGDVRTWDFGIGDMMDAMAMMNAASPERPQTEAEKDANQEMLRAMYANQQVEEMYGGNASFLNRAGTMAGYMPSFVVDFVVTGGGFEGLNIAGKAATKLATNAVGKEAVEQMAKLGVKRYVKDYGARGLGQVAGNFTIKALGTTADDLLIRAPLMTNTVQAGKTASDIIDRKLGDVVVDEDGNYWFADERSWGSAIWQGEANSIIENYSEMFGAHLPEVATMKNLGKLANVIGAKRLGNVLAKADAGALGGITESTRRIFQQMGVSDYFGEVAEEYYGQLWRTMLNLDDAYQQNADGTRTNLLASGQFHGDIWGGMALSMGLMGAGKTTMSAANYLSMKHDVNKADARAGELLTPDVWEPLRATIDTSTNDNVGDVAEAIVNDKDMTAEEKAAVLNYMERSLYLRGANLAELAKSRGSEGVQQARGVMLQQRQKLEETLTPEAIADIDRDPAGALGKLGEDEEVNGMVRDYVNAKLAYDEMVQRERDDDWQRADECYIDGYNAQSDVEMQDAKNQYELQRQRLLSLSGVTEEWVADAIDNDDPVVALRSVVDVGNWSEEEANMVRDYINAKQVYDGMIQRIRDDIDGRIERSNAMIDSRRNRMTGMIQGATLKVKDDEGRDRRVYVIGGNLAMLEDGSGIDHEKSHNSIIIRDAETGKIEMVSPEAILSVEEPVDAEAEKQSAAEAIRQQTAQEAAVRIDGTVAFTPGDTYTLTDENGQAAQVQIVANQDGLVDNGDGTVNVSSDGGQTVVPMRKEDIQAMVDATNFARVVQAEQQRAAMRQPTTAYSLNDEVTLTDDGGNAVRGVVTGGINEDGMYEVETESPINGRKVNLFTAEELDRLQAKSDEQSRVLSLSTMDTENGAAQGGSAQTVITPDGKGSENVDGTQEPQHGVAAEETDDNGIPMVQSSDGSTVFGQVTGLKGMKEAPIKMSEGFNKVDSKGQNHGYGLEHIEAAHGNQIRQAGYPSVVAFVESVAKNYTTALKGNPRNGKETYLLEYTDGHNNTLFIELSNDGTYWNVNSAGIFREGYSEKKEIVEPVPAVGSGISNDAAEVRSANKVGNSMSGNSPVTTSDGKGNENVSDGQQSALERVPKDWQGQPLYEQADPDTAWEAIVEQAGGDEATAQDVANDMVADKEAALKKLEKQKPKGGTTPAEKIAARLEQKRIVEQARANLAAWQRIAQTPQRRRQAEAAEKARIAEEQARLLREQQQRQRAEQQEAERMEREALEGVPDMVDDTPQAARARGYRRVNGHKVDRQQPLQAVQGREVAVKFGDDAMPRGRVALIDAGQLQPSHIDGQRNPLHFIDEAQPKERNDEASVLSARKIAAAIRPEEITSSVTAYTGAPTVNSRGEVIQGNNRSAALREMWERNPEQARRYKQYLAEHAADFGLEAGAVEAMRQPVLVNMLEVPDGEAITLGQYVAQDTESGGTERIKPRNAVHKMGAGGMKSFASQMLDSPDEEMTFAELVDRNGAGVLKWMQQRGYITPTQYRSAFDSRGNLTAEAKNDLRGIMYQSIFQGGGTRLEEMFNALPAKAQKAILATAYRDHDSPNQERMNAELQASVSAYHALSQVPEFANARNYKEARQAVEMWKRQLAFDDVTGESYLPSERYSNFAVLLATMYKGQTQTFTQNVLKNIFDLVQGTQETTLFDEPDNTPRTLAEAINEAINNVSAELLINDRFTYDGQRGSNVLAGGGAASQQGRQGSPGGAASGGRAEDGTEPADSDGRAANDSNSNGGGRHGGENQGGEEKSTKGQLTKTEAAEIIANMEERAEVAPDMELNIENWDALFGEDGIVNTPIGEVKMGEHQFAKLMRQGRNGKLGMVKPTLENPDIIIEDESRAKDGDIAERPSSYVFVKTFLKEDGSRYYYFTSITVSREGREVVVSSQEKSRNRILRLMLEGSVIWRTPKDAATSSAEKQGLDYAHPDEAEDATKGSGITPQSTSSDGKGSEKSRIGSKLGEKVAQAEAETEQNPTDGQKEAGNYKKGHVRIGQFDITVENPKGSVRSGVDARGNRWETTMQNTYGYIRGTEGVDGDHIDVFLTDDIDGWNGRKVYVVDQYNEDGTFDEHKVMLGFNDEADAKDAYFSNYSKDWAEKHKIVMTPVNLEDFGKWIDSSYRKTKPFAEYKSVRKDGARNEPKAGFEITPAQYTTKRGKVLDMFLVKFAEPLNKEQQRAARELAKAEKGWYDRDKGGFMMRSEESAQRLAGTITGNEEAVSDAQPLSLADIREAEPQRHNWKYGVSVDNNTGHTRITRSETANGIPVDDANFELTADSPQEMLDILGNPQNGLEEVLDAVRTNLENAVKTRSMDSASETEAPQPRRVDIEGLANSLRKNGEARLSDHTEPRQEEENAYGANNKLVSRERYEELKRLMRAKLRGQLNMGIDPEILAIGLQMATFHIESGSRKFADYARRMIADLGDNIRPYLKSFYNGARDLPEVIDSGLAEEMTPYDEVRTFDTANFGKGHANPFSTAETVVAEQELGRQAAEAKNSLTVQRNEKERRKRNRSNGKDVSSHTAGNLFDGLPETEREEARATSPVRNTFNVGDKVLYKGSPATVHEIDGDGKLTLDTGLAPVMYEVADPETVERINDNNNGNEVHLRNGSGTAERERGYQPQQNEPLGKSAKNKTERPDGRRMDRRDTTRPRPDEERGGGVSRISEGTDVVTNPKNTRNNHSGRGADHAPTSADARIAANIKAIELSQQLVQNGETATPEQMEVLRRFSGWGGLGKAFSDTATTRRLQELLGAEAYEQAVMSANSAYYTPAYVVDTLWDIAGQMGFKGGNILEGSAGIGNILGQMPTGISQRSDIHAIEIDSTSGNILSLLYPDAKVEIQGFEQTHISNGSIDLAITNVPFVTGLRVDDTTGDKDLSRKFHNIHDFCIAKNVRKLRDGGIGIFISSSGTLDNSKKLRDWIVGEGGADFVGAFRLNNKTFGGTSVTSDIIVIRKRVNGRKSAYAIDASTVSGERTVEYDTGETRKVQGQEVPIVKHLSMDYNRYFIEHPEHMAGKMRFAFEEGDTFRPTSKGLYPSRGKDQEKMLADFVESFAGKDWTEEVGVNQTSDLRNPRGYVMDASADGKKLGELYVKDGKLVIASAGGYYPLEVNANKVKGHTKVECFNAYSAIKDALSDVLEYQANNEDDKGLRPLLDRLNKAYDDFVSTYGHFNKNTAIAFLRNDVDYPNVFSLEKFEETGDKSGKRVQTFSKSDVFSKRVVEKEKEPAPTNVKDGILASVFKFGRIDIPYIAEQIGESVESVKNDIIENGYGFEDPATKQVEVSFQYLSGNVREKLRQAEENNDGGIYDKNIKALQDVLPMDIPAHLIDFTLGSSWIAPKLYEDYVRERTDIDVRFTAVGGTWFMKALEYGLGMEKNRSFGVYSEQFKRTIMGHTLIEAAIQNKTVTVSQTYRKRDGSTETVTDKEATQACSVKIDEIRQDFKDWARGKMQSDADMSAEMERAYNDTFNNYVPMEIPDEFVPKYFGGASHKFKMRPHQGKAIVRGTMQPLMLSHEVGTGKTFTLISTAMEMRRLGTARKPMIVVQNATVGQFVSSAKELYPNAKILTLEEADRSTEGRRNFYAKIRYNDWDMIVVPQSTFDFIPDSEERQMAFIQGKIEEKLIVLEQMKNADPGGNSMITRQAKREIEQLQEQLAGLTDESSKKRGAADQKKRAVALQNAEVRAKEMLDRATDDVDSFDDMGIDALLVDEAHEYKHLGFATAMQSGVKGVDPSYSKKSQGVYLKVQAVMEKTGGRNVIFATGTPISNTAAEIWTFMRYLMPADTMKDYGIYYFDDFVRNFGNIQQMLEFATNGKFKENNRFAGYVNLPELVRIWLGVADIVRTKEAGGVSDKIPEMEGGKAQDIYLPQTRALRGIMNYVKEQLEEFEKMSGKEKKANSHIPLTMFGIAKAAAVDARLVQADAIDDPDSKTNEAVRQTLRSLKETAGYKGTVAIFADNYQNKQSGFNLYEDIRGKLVAEGVPGEQIVVMKPGMTAKKKLEIFDKVNRGEVRVILGSTFTLGTGVNIQERLHTLIHLDAPNRPMDYTQRNGRILRQGNIHKSMGKPVRILRFGVEDSLDVTAYQRLKTKGAIADSIMDGKKMLANSMANRVLEEEEDVFGDTVAQLSGSEYAMLKNNAEKNVRKYESRKKQWEADQTYIHNTKPKLQAIIVQSEQRAKEQKGYLEAVRKAFPRGRFTEIYVGKHTFRSVEEMADFIKEHNKGIQEETKKMKEGGTETQTRNLSISLGGYTFNVQTVLSREMARGGGQLFSEVRRKMTYSCPELGLADVPVHQSLLRNAIEDIVGNVITGKDFAERAEAAERRAEHNRSELQQLLSREGQPFEFEKELAQAREQLQEYTEAMKKEMAEKEAKYAEMDASVGATGGISLTEEDSEELYREGEELEEANGRFNEELQRYQDGEMDRNEMFHLGNPNGVMRMFLPNLPIVMRQRVVNKGSNRKHDVEVYALANMPKMISQPIFVFKKNDDSVGILTEMKDRNGRNVFVAFDIASIIQDGGNYLEVNNITTVHGRRIENVVRPILENNSLQWVGKEKGLAWLSSASPDVQQEIDKQDLVSAANVVKNFQNPSIDIEERLGDGNEAAARSQTMEEIEERAREVAGRLNIGVKVAHSTSEVGNENARRAIDDGRNVKGWYDPRTGEIVLYLPNATSAEDAVRTVLHEGVAHYGLRRMFGRHFDTFLDNVFRNASEEVRRRIVELSRKHGWNFRTATEEYLAGLAERTEFENARQTSWWQKVKDFFMEMLAKAGIRLSKPLDDGDLRYILWRSYENLRGEQGIFAEAADIAKRHELGVENGSPTQSPSPTLPRREGGLRGGKAARIEKLRRSKPVVATGNEYKGKYELERDSAQKYILDNLRGEYVIKDTGETIQLSKKGAKKVTSHSQGNIAHMKSVALIPQIIENAVFVEERPAYKEDAQYDSYRYYLTGLKIGADDYTVRITIGVKNGKYYYDHYLTNIEKGNLIEIANSFKPTEDAPNPSYAGIKDKVLLSILQAKSEENGESGGEVLYREGDPEVHERVLARERYEQRVKRGMFQMQEALQDSMLGLREAMEAVLKGEGRKRVRIEEVDGFENAYLGENCLSSVNKAEADAFAHLLIKPLLDEVARLAKTRARRDELTDYMMAKHGLERNRVMAERDAQRAYEENRQKHPHSKKTLEDFVEEFRQKDYAGLTALTGIDDVAAAEEEARLMVDDYEERHDTGRLWERTRGVSGAILSKLYETGMMSKETYDNVRSMYEYYIPLRGFDEKTSAEAYAYLNSKDSAFTAPIKTAKGRKSKADDPLAYLQSMAEGAIMQGNRNKLVKQRFLNFVLNHPSDLASVSELWLKYDEVAGEWKPVFPDNINADDTPAEVERKMQDFEEKMRELAEQAPDQYKHGKDTVGIPYRVVEQRDLRQHQVVVKRGGRDYVVTINGNPRAAQALNGQTNPDNDLSGAVGAVLKAGERVNRELSALYTTRNPDFVVSNFIRDMLYTNSMAWIKENPRYALRFHRNYLRANPARMKLLLAKHRQGKLDMNDRTERMFHQFMMNGGETGYANARDIEKHKNDIRREIRKAGGRLPVGRAWDLLAERLDEVNRGVENCARFAAFMTSREMGRTLDRSIYDAKEISVNFNKKGSGAKFMGATGQTPLGNASAFVSGLGRSGFVFWNAAIQGTTNFGRQVKRHPAKALTGVAVMFLLGAVVAWLGHGDDDDDDKDSYWNLPEYVRRSNLMFRAGDQWISIPLPVEYRAVYGLGELMVSTMSGKEHLTGGELASQIAGQVSQTLPLDFLEGGGGFGAFIPSSVKPLAEAYWYEKSWTGLPLYKDTPFNKNMPEWTKAYKSANKYLVDMSETLNEISGGDKYTKGAIDINPAKVEHVLNGYFGGVANTVDRLTKMGETIAGEREYDPQNFLVLNRVLKNGDERTEYKAVNNEYFRLKEEHDRTGERLRKYEHDTVNGIFDYAEKMAFLYSSPEYLRYEIFEAYRPVLDELYDILKEANARGDQDAAKGIEAQLNELKKMMIGEMEKTRK